MEAPSAANHFPRIVALCFVTALFEGFDIQSIGVAAPKLAPAFYLEPARLGLGLSASTFGLMLGALAGGWLSDRLGRKPVIVASMITLELFSLATTISGPLHNLLLIRVDAGVGLGGAFPTLIALVSEMASPQSRVTALAFMYCGLPIGGALAGLVVAFAAADWRSVFYVGGIGPLILAPVLTHYLGGAPSTRLGQRSDISRERVFSLFGPRTRMTLLLWTSYFFTLLVVYLLLNWLPSLMIKRGYSSEQASASAVVLNVGAVIGSLVLGYFSDRVRTRVVLSASYLGMIASLLLLASRIPRTLVLGSFAAGFFVIGGQLVLYSIAPNLYPRSISGTGVGAAVAVGRIGSIVGPLLGGALLASGLGPEGVPAAATPGLVIALICLLWLLRRTGLD